MSKFLLLTTALLFPLAAAAQTTPESAPVPAAEAVPAPSADGASAESVKVGTGVANRVLEGEASSFSVAAGTRIYAWAQLAGMTPGTALKIVWKRDGTEVSSSNLSTAVPTARWRTHGYKTFRAGDAGSWTAVFMTQDGAELGSASFTVEITGG